MFLIATVRPYGSGAETPGHRGSRRCVSAYHHQLSERSIPLCGVSRFITLMKNPENASIVREELRALEGKYGAQGRESPTIPDAPCPYTASLLASAWSTNLDRGDEVYTSGTLLTQDTLWASMGAWDGGESIALRSCARASD